ncbi:hypothetical protein HK100_009348 [Physocladia obscura]|uniref:Uncharacterized protein n=1 Tax=Physocladia obscura TaxID=109957 RepID=A0AAD5T535_9FUNG|nr:hypothetical protein HK100_009348 [Physocladia obscura]
MTQTHTFAGGILGTAAVVELGAFAVHEWRKHKRHDATTSFPAFTEYQTPHGPIFWKPINGGPAPVDAIQLRSDSDGAALFAARAAIHGGWHTGKARDNNQACISYGGREEYIKGAFQVLCGSAAG